MRRRTRIILVVVLVFVIGYMIVNKDGIIIERLTNGPPSLATLQTDTKDLQNQVDELKKDIGNMKAQASQGTAAANNAMMNLKAVKNST